MRRRRGQREVARSRPEPLRALSVTFLGRLGEAEEPVAPADALGLALAFLEPAFNGPSVGPCDGALGSDHPVDDCLAATNRAEAVEEADDGQDGGELVQNAERDDQCRKRDRRMQHVKALEGWEAGEQPGLDRRVGRGRRPRKGRRRRRGSRH
jgi:hypothetical protein